jgi:hypothetical protein
LACRWWRQSFLYNLLRLVCNQSPAEPCHTLSPPVQSQVGLKTGSCPIAALILVIVTSRVFYRPADRPQNRLFAWAFLSRVRQSRARRARQALRGPVCATKQGPCCGLCPSQFHRGDWRAKPVAGYYPRNHRTSPLSVPPCMVSHSFDNRLQNGGLSRAERK